MDIAAIQTLQIGFWQGVFGIAVVLVAIGGSWSSLKTAVTHIDKDLDRVKHDLDGVKTDLKDIRERFAASEGKFSRLP
jgi:hypothetical protein